MISISKLLCNHSSYGDILRYSRPQKSSHFGIINGRGPVVVWNVTRNCNLRCKHCYASAGDKKLPDELSTKQGKKIIRDLAECKVPVLLFSGGEPLMRPDFFELAAYAVKLGIRCVLSTNGTLITPDIARNLKECGVSYVGVSLDGIGEKNDFFRGRRGAFEDALSGIRNCRQAGLRVGLRFTISRYNYNEIDDIFKLAVEEEIPRLCFYHLVYSGRGKNIMDADISHEQSRAVLDLIMKRTEEFCKRGLQKEVLTVDNHADGVYLYLKLKRRDEHAAARALELLRNNGGNKSGISIGQVDWRGDVHPDQFTPNYTLGNVLKRKFGDIWSDLSHPLMAKLKNRKFFLKGRCAVCKWLDICNGNFRARAEAISGDFWGPDPACYLTDEEIGLNKVPDLISGR